MRWQAGGKGAQDFIVRNGNYCHKYVEKNTYLGQTKDNYLYLVYSKDGIYLDYKEYLK